MINHIQIGKLLLRLWINNLKRQKPPNNAEKDIQTALSLDKMLLMYFGVKKNLTNWLSYMNYMDQSGQKCAYISRKSNVLFDSGPKIQ